MWFPEKISRGTRVRSYKNQALSVGLIHMS